MLGLSRAVMSRKDRFGAETVGATKLFFFMYLGVPVSTTHTITGAMVGVGAAASYYLGFWMK